MSKRVALNAKQLLTAAKKFNRDGDIDEFEKSLAARIFTWTELTPSPSARAFALFALANQLGHVIARLKAHGWKDMPTRDSQRRIIEFIGANVLPALERWETDETFMSHEDDS